MAKAGAGEGELEVGYGQGKAPGDRGRARRARQAPGGQAAAGETAPEAKEAALARQARGTRAPRRAHDGKAEGEGPAGGEGGPAQKTRAKPGHAPAGKPTGPQGGPEAAKAQPAAKDKAPKPSGVLTRAAGPAREHGPAKEHGTEAGAHDALPAPGEASVAPVEALANEGGAVATAKEEAVATTEETPEEAVATAKEELSDELFLRHQRELLEGERNNYVRQAEELRREAEALALEHEPGDVQFDEEGGEGGTANVDRELDLHLSQQAQAAIEEIDAALAKIDQGTYGLCENCGAPIPRARLEALPHARLCVACKSGGLAARRQ